MAIDVIKAYGCRVVEGLDIDDLASADDTAYLQFNENASREVYHKPSGKRITLECVSRYFEPTQSYYRFNDKSSCDYIKKGLNARSCSNCQDCLKKCISQRLAVKPKKLTIAANYFE